MKDSESKISMFYFLTLKRFLIRCQGKLSVLLCVGRVPHLENYEVDFL